MYLPTLGADLHVAAHVLVVAARREALANVVAIARRERHVILARDRRQAHVVGLVDNLVVGNRPFLGCRWRRRMPTCGA